MPVAIAHREPGSDRLDTRRKIAALAEAKHDACEDEAGYGTYQAVRSGRDAPHNRSGCQTKPNADLVSQPSHASIADGIGDGEEEDDVAEIGFSEMQIALNCWLEHAKDVAIHIVDRGDREQQTTDNPAVVAGWLGPT